MSAQTVARRRKSAPVKQEVVALAAPENIVLPYDENLLERCRTQWQFGDWQSLALLDRETIQHHPDRAKLALLAAAGAFQVGSRELARQFIQLAKDWGCGNKLMLKILAAGVHNSLGRAAAQSGNPVRALRHFEDSIRLGSPSADTRLITQARTGEQFSQLGLTAKFGALAQSRAAPAMRDIPAPYKSSGAAGKAPISVEAFYSEREGDRAASLMGLREFLRGCAAAQELPEMAWVAVAHRNKPYHFAHFAGDYIPSKMAEKSQFYESPYLNLLARLHEPGKLIVDGGANIGNHSVFFAGAMGAPVIAFEPQPHNYAILLANVHLNHLERLVDARDVAIGAHTGHIELAQVLAGNYGAFSADADLLKKTAAADSGVPRFGATLSTLDAELTDCRSKVSIIKLDLEGMELAALQGATGIITDSMPVIAVECFTRSVFQKVKEFLAAFDYFVIDSTNATPTFIFLSRKNPGHQEKLSRYLEQSSVGKFAANKSFNEVAE
ncbi:MAG: FkbM family methyltransferase [Rhodocyclaceae bacterium]|nr:FkbM family methyltransferase [Rhodocyclaceae bacterium]